MAFTFFFRDSHTIAQIIKYFLPTVEGYSKIKVWDAGCAMGPEVYTFAIMLAEKMGYFPFKRVFIDATDIDENDTFGDIVKKGVYSYEDLKRIPEDVFKKYFEIFDENNYYRISDLIRSRVEFAKHDLLTLQPKGTGYNLIFCKNVLLHFQQSERIKVIDMFWKSLSPGGIFATEQTQQMPDELKNRWKKLASDANVYQKIG